MATPENLHKNIPNGQLHSPKDFSTAGSGTALRKGWDGDLKWEVPYWQDSVLDRVDMALTPPTELDGDRYILINLTSTVVNADWDGASENDIVEYDLDASAWVSQTPFFDITVRSQSDLAQYYFDGTTWNDASGATTNTLQEVITEGSTYTGSDAISMITTSTIVDRGDTSYTAFGGSSASSGRGSSYLTPTDARFRLETGIGVYSELNLTSASMLITDLVNSKGLEYASDYSGAFTARSLIDKGYADATYQSSGSYLSNVVEDTTPQLGGNLDVQANEIVSTGSNNIVLHSNASAYVELGDNLGANTFDIRDNASTVKAQFKSTGDLGVGTTASSGAWTSLAGSNNNRAHINFTGGTADKTTPVDGDLWYNTTTGALNFYDGTTTTDLLAGGGGGTPAGSTGQIQFNTSGAFDAESTLFWDKTNDRLGIGIATPNYEIHTHGADANTYIQITNSLSGTTGTDGCYFGLESTTFAFIQNETGGISFRTGGADRMIIQNGGVVEQKNGAIVGGGSTSLVGAMSVHKTTGSYIHFANTSTGFTGGDGFYVGHDNAVNGAILYLKENQPIIFSTNDTEQMRLKGSGVLNYKNCPTSSAGLSAGDIWSDSGTLKIV